jgi:hypothetical protein
MNKIDKIIAILFLVAGLIGITIIFTHCAVNRVNNSERKQQKVVENYIKKHPFKNDTLIIVKHSRDTLTQTNERIDTILQSKLVNDTVLNPIYIIKTITVTKTIIDTVEKKIIDHTLQLALQDAIENSNKIIAENKASISELKYKLDKWRIRFFILLALNTLFVVWKIRKLFTPI